MDLRDSLKRLHHKLRSEAAARPTARSDATGDPPPSYTTAMHNDISGLYDDEHESDGAPTLSINAATSISGSSNLIAIPPLDAARLGSLVLAVLNAQRAAAQVGQELNVNLHINCGVAIVGDRNVLGSAALGLRNRPPSPSSNAAAEAGASAGGAADSAATGTTPAVAAPGVAEGKGESPSGDDNAKKRKASDEDLEDSPKTKRLAGGSVSPTS